MSGIRYGISDYTPLVLETVTWLPVAILQWMLYAVVHHALAGCKGWSSKKKKKNGCTIGKNNTTDTMGYCQC